MAEALVHQNIVLSADKHKKNVIQNLITDINTKNEVSVDKINELIVELDDIVGTDLEDVKTILTAVNNLISENGDGANILAILDLVVDSLNDRKLTKIVNATFTSETGVATVDISGFGFADISEYEFLADMETTKNVEISKRKVDENTVEISIRDRECWEFDNLDAFDASEVENNIPIKLFVIYSPLQISKTVTEADGDETVIGA